MQPLSKTYSSISERIKTLYLFFEEHPKVSLFIVVVIGVAFRLFHLDYQSLWVDELYSVVPVNPANDLTSVIEHCKRDQPPFYFLILHYYYHIVDYTSYNGRLLSVIFGLLGICSIYALGKEIHCKTAGLFVAFVVSINYYHIYYSQELRFYSLVFLLATLSYLFFIRANKELKWQNLLYYFLITTCLLYTHYFGLLIVFIQGLCSCLLVLKKENQNKQFILSWASVFILLLISLIPWLATIVHDLGISAYWISPPDPVFFVNIYFEFFNNDLLVVYIMLGLLAFPLYLFFIDREVLFSKISKTDFLILASWLVLSFLIPYIYSVVRTPILYPRYLMVTLPVVFVLASIGFVSIHNPLIRMTILSIVLMSTVIQYKMINGYYFNFRYPDIRAAATVLEKNYDGQSNVYSQFEWWFNFYLYNSKPKISIRDPQQVDFKREIQSQESIWLIGMHGSALQEADQKLVDSLFIQDKEFKCWETYVLFLKRKK